MSFADRHAANRRPPLPCWALTATILLSLPSLGAHCHARTYRAPRPQGVQCSIANIPRCPQGTRERVYGRYGRCERSCLDARGRYHGVFARRYLQPNNRTRYTASYEHGKLHGISESYDRQGRLQWRRGYAMNRPHGAWQQYRLGKLVSDMRYVNGRRYGEQRTYSQGQLVSLSTYGDNNTLHGRCAQWNTTGQLLGVQTYKRGRLHGPWRQVSGIVVVEGNYRDGLPNGRFSARTLAGKKLGSFIMREGDGEWRSYAGDGTVLVRKQLRIGMLHGSYLTFHANGQLHVRGHYFRGRPHGPWCTFDVRGRALYRDLYRVGRRLSRSADAKTRAACEQRTSVAKR